MTGSRHMYEHDVLVLIGQIGAGKSAVCSALESSEDVRHVDIEDLRGSGEGGADVAKIADQVASAISSRHVVFECTGASKDFEEIIEQFRRRNLRPFVALLDCSTQTALQRVRERGGRVRPKAGGTWAPELDWTESRLRLVPADMTLRSDRADPGCIAADIWKGWATRPRRMPDTVPSKPRDVSFSELAAREICPWSYRLKYLDHVPEMVETEQMYLGSRLHEALAWLYSGGDGGCDKAELVHWFRSRVAETLPEGTDGATASRLSQRGEEALVFHHEVAYSSRPSRTIAVERPIRMPCDPWTTFVGRVDRVAIDASGTVEVIDYKTSPRRRTSRPRIPDWLQVAAYAVAVLRELDVPNVIARRVMLATGEEEQFAVSREDTRQVKLSLARWARSLAARGASAKRPGAHCGSCQFNPACDGATGFPIARGAFVRETAESGRVAGRARSPVHRDSKYTPL